MSHAGLSEDNKSIVVNKHDRTTFTIQLHQESRNASPVSPAGEASKGRGHTIRTQSDCQVTLAGVERLTCRCEMPILPQVERPYVRSSAQPIDHKAGHRYDRDAAQRPIRSSSAERIGRSSCSASRCSWVPLCSSNMGWATTEGVVRS